MKRKVTRWWWCRPPHDHPKGAEWSDASLWQERRLRNGFLRQQHILDKSRLALTLAFAAVPLAVRPASFVRQVPRYCRYLGGPILAHTKQSTLRLLRLCLKCLSTFCPIPPSCFLSSCKHIEPAETQLAAIPYQAKSWIYKRSP